MSEEVKPPLAPQPEDKEEACGTCGPNSPCDACAWYWERMRREGLWRDGYGWSDEVLKGCVR